MLKQPQNKSSGCCCMIITRLLYIKSNIMVILWVFYYLLRFPGFPGNPGNGLFHSRDPGNGKMAFPWTP